VELLIKSLPLLSKGLLTTLWLSVAATGVATLLGLVFAMAQLFGGRPLRWAVEVYLYVIRGVPLLVLLFAMYYALPYAGVQVEPVTGGIVVIGTYFGAFMTEVFRAAILAVPRGQWEAGRAIGMRTPAILRDVILGQAVRIAAAPYVNTAIMVVKGTSLVAVIGLADITFVGRQIVERTLAPFVVFGAVAFAYFVICYALSRVGRYAERKAAHVH
jgi:His/Glu/Gln/Arg/opine family amino acid ABC transporter permease subunit